MLEADLAAANSHIEVFAAQRDSIQAQMSALQADLAKAQGKEGRLRVEIEKLRAGNAEQLNEHQNELHETQLRLKVSETSIEQCTSELAVIQQCAESLQSKLTFNVPDGNDSPSWALVFRRMRAQDLHAPRLDSVPRELSSTCQTLSIP